MTKRGLQGFTIAELMIAMALSIMIIAALTLSAIQLQKSLYASETFALSSSDQRRLLDYLARDLRRSIGIAVTKPDGTTAPMGAETISIGNGTALVLTLPGYYKSNVPGSADFVKPLPVISTATRVDYGSNSTPAPGVPVTFRKELRPEEKSVCFVRQEAQASEVIVRGAADLELQVTLARDGKSCTLAVSFNSVYSRARRKVFTYDTVLLRNLRLDAPL